ncbi:hypothetical protein pdam_00005696 [Pocillopora damicornis]|uniref:Uncharacterized protein n=1 Tax=Pocillopora damicornis TaxID=46731 RepID=A0A3M6UZX4_POCDA|nr:hypothetical protein pdam_00005696 [Pocillopora damicornis]
MGITVSALKELRLRLSFTQLRFHCSKKQGRTFRVTTVSNSTGEGNQHLKEVAVRDCESHAVTLIYNGHPLLHSNLGLTEPCFDKMSLWG